MTFANSTPYATEFKVEDVEGIACIDITRSGDAFIWRSDNTFIMIPSAGGYHIDSAKHIDADSDQEWNGCD